MRAIVFGLIFIFFAGSIWQNTQKLNSDIFSLIDVKLNPYDEKIVQNYNSQNDFSILFKDANDKEHIIKSAKNSNLFINRNLEDFNINVLNKMSLAFMDKNKINLIKNNQELFFDNSIKDLFLPFKIKLLSDDFFGLVSTENLNFGAKFDPKTKLLKTDNFYLINYELKPDYDYDKLLEFAKSLKKIDSVFLNSPALYAAEAKKIAITQSTYLGIISTILSGFFIFMIFRNIKVFYILVVVIFSLVCALGGTLLTLKSVNFLTIVISTSLIGLILDYGTHFLSANMGKSIEPTSVKNVKTTLLSAFFITSIGYAIFLFSPMKFLHEIAVFSIFALSSALLSSYFLFPNLIKNERFTSHVGFDKFLNFYINCCKFCLKYIKTVLAFVLVFMFIALFKIVNLDFKDNIKNYSLAPQNLVDDSKVFMNEMSGFMTSKFIIVDENSTSKLVAALAKDRLIENPFYFSLFLNDSSLQVKEIFKTASKDPKIISKYENYGFDRRSLDAEFAKIINQKIFSPRDICDALKAKCDNFFIDGKEIIYVSKAKINGEFDGILSEFNATYSDYISNLNSGFTAVKANAVLLKLCGFGAAFVILWLFLGFKKALDITTCIVFVSMFCVCLFVILGLEIDIFVIFGLILATAVGIDYMLFAFNDRLVLKERILGILAASITSICSFGTLGLSSTNAVFSFGFSVSIAILIISFVASMLALRSEI